MSKKAIVRFALCIPLSIVCIELAAPTEQEANRLWKDAEGKHTLFKAHQKGTLDAGDQEFPKTSQEMEQLYLVAHRMGTAANVLRYAGLGLFFLGFALVLSVPMRPIIKVFVAVGDILLDDLLRNLSPQLSTPEPKPER